MLFYIIRLKFILFAFNIRLTKLPLSPLLELVVLLKSIVSVVLFV